jgi:hypothetical protein
MSVRKLPISRGLEVLLDEADFVNLSRYRWSALMRGGVPYAARWVGGKVLTMHRVILEAPVGIQVDHINNDSLDNRRENLRLCTQAENLRNRRSRVGASRFKGVSPAGMKWRADIRLNGRAKYIGTFPTEEEAARAYDAKASEIYGEFASLNFSLEDTRRGWIYNNLSGGKGTNLGCFMDGCLCAPRHEAPPSQNSSPSFPDLRKQDSEGLRLRRYREPSTQNTVSGQKES